jgi:hypothetical protein
MQVKIKTLVGKIYPFDVKPDETVDGLKRLVAERLNVPPEGY